jgi:hypothetical protein
MILDEREKFYGEFLRHAVASALLTISEAKEQTLGRPMSPQQKEQIAAMLRDGLAEFQNMKPMELSPFDVVLAGRICVAVIDEGDSIEPFLSECRGAVLGLIANFAESLNDFIAEVRPDVRPNSN